MSFFVFLLGFACAWLIVLLNRLKGYKRWRHLDEFIRTCDFRLRIEYPSINCIYDIYRAEWVRDRHRVTMFVVDPPWALYQTMILVERRDGDEHIPLAYFPGNYWGVFKFKAYLKKL